MKTFRFLNRDGSFNVDRSTYKSEAWNDIYHVLLSASWLRLLLFISCLYFAVNAIFGVCYFLAGPEALHGIEASSELDRFWECFFFSVQTLATIGYGQISPVSAAAHVLVTFEALTGLTGLALATGIVFARFSKPSARVRFSEKALITQVGGVQCFMFRMANARLNHVAEAQVRVILTRRETTEEGLIFRELYDLPLERDRSPIFAMSWTVIHPIDEKSPLYGITLEKLRGSLAEIVVTMSGTDETFSQTVQARYSYIAEDIELGKQFEDMILMTPEGKLKLDLSQLSRTR